MINRADQNWPTEHTYKIRAFPNTSVDRGAWEQAKTELGKDANVHAVIARAQQIKERGL